MNPEASFRGTFARSLVVLAALTAAVSGLAAVLLNPPRTDLAQLAIFLSLSGAVTMAAAIAAARPGRGLLRSVRSKLLFAMLLSASLVLLNVGFTAYLMFVSSHDLALLSLLLAFSLAVSAFFATVVSQSLEQRVRSLLDGVRAIGSGNLGTRVHVTTGDEIEQLGEAVNLMAERLDAAFARERGLEEARRQLVASVSHDLRTPLATMRIMVENMNEGVVDDPQTVYRYLRSLQNEIDYLSRLIDDLFELSQIDAGRLELRPEPASMVDLISDTLEALSPQAEARDLSLEGDVDHALPTIVMDTGRIQRVLYNLVLNAFRHTPADGTVIIRAVDEGTEVAVSVIDTGEGIGPEDLPRVFSRFNRGTNQARTRDGSGSGLGLTIAKGIVELHGGRIWAESVPGGGSTFTFALPKDGA